MKEIQKVLRQVPIIPIRGSVVFPYTDTVLSFGRQKTVSAINAGFAQDRIVAIFGQVDPKNTDPDFNDLYNVGTICMVTQMMSSDGEIHAIVKGQARIRLDSLLAHEPHLIGYVYEIPTVKEDTDEVMAMANHLVEMFKKAVGIGKQVEIMTAMRIMSGQMEPYELVDQIGSLLDIKMNEKQKLLEETSLFKRLQMVIELFAKEMNILEIEKTISKKTEEKFEDQMRKAMLREKKKTIEKELGEEASEMDSDEIAEYKKKIKEAGMPEAVLAKTKKELKKLMSMNPNNPETGYIKNYLDWLVDMPWSKFSPNNISIARAEQILKSEHYGIEKAKERILEYLAVMQLKKHQNKKKKKDQTQPTILCFVGPPGVGKTSIGKSIAKALGRQFVRMSLGGIRDEAEIRGHRRTYVGALPGRIIQGVKNAGTGNPVFMLDEIDKIGADFRGDPSSALLEALDPEQNRDFSDHYLDVPYDLSQVIFIATGNLLDSIPDALRDRMEIIRFPGYTQNEKLHIAKKFLWNKQLIVNGLEKKVKITDRGLDEIINFYTREAGVRGLERNIASVLRKVAKLVAEKKNYPKVVTQKEVKKFLGPQRFSSTIAEKKNEIGMATGLAVTSAGGEILFVEVVTMPGKGGLILTGQLGDVMKESARAAFSWTKANWKSLGLSEKFGDKIDVHIHVPEGAVPKDGPSAGVAMATALVSALTKRPVKREVGMTGEITLRGRVLEIGGVKEKVIAGYRAGLKTIILPKENKKDMEDVPAEIKKNIHFVFADNFASAQKHIFA